MVCVTCHKRKRKCSHSIEGGHNKCLYCTTNNALLILAGAVAVFCNHCINNIATAYQYQQPSHTQSSHHFFQQQQIRHSLVLFATHKAPSSPLAGLPLSPSSPSIDNNNNSIIIRYFYEGGQINQGRMCYIPLPPTTAAATSDTQQQKQKQVAQIIICTSSNASIIK